MNPRLEKFCVGMKKKRLRPYLRRERGSEGDYSRKEEERSDDLRQRSDAKRTRFLTKKREGGAVTSLLSRDKKGEREDLKNLLRHWGRQEPPRRLRRESVWGGGVFLYPSRFERGYGILNKHLTEKRSTGTVSVGLPTYPERTRFWKTGNKRTA